MYTLLPGNWLNTGYFLVDNQLLVNNWFRNLPVIIYLPLFCRLLQHLLPLSLDDLVGHPMDPCDPLLLELVNLSLIALLLIFKSPKASRIRFFVRWH